MKRITPEEQSEIVTQARQFLDKTLFKQYPELRDKVAVLIVSSVAEGLVDKRSDIDLKCILPQQFLDAHREEMLEYEKKVDGKNNFQLVLRDSYDGLRRLAENWDDDNLIREIGQGILIHDPTGEAAVIIRALHWYPDEIFRDKVNYLFHHIIFQIDHFYRVSVKRNDRFGNLVTKGRLLEVFMTLTFFLERRHPNGKKMYLYFGELPHIPEGLREVIEEMFTEPNGEEGLRLAQQGRKILEKVLIERGLIPKESDQYWLSYQPKHEVRFSMIPL